MVKDDLIAWLADIGREFKPSTKRFYGGRSKWIREALGELDWPALTPALVLRALDKANRWPSGEQKAPDTIRGNMIAWEQFQAWAKQTGRCEANVLKDELKKPAGRLRERLPNVDEVRRIIEGASPQFGMIYRALLLTGSRPGELCRATLADWNRADGLISLADHKTVAKTKRPRLIPIGDHCRGLLETAAGDRTDGPIFLTPGGKAWTTATLSQTFRRRRELLSLGDDLVLYSTRHKFATELCHTLGIEAAAAVLGHAALQTTRRYVHHSGDQLRKYANAVTPDALGTPSPPAAIE